MSRSCSNIMVRPGLLPGWSHPSTLFVMYPANPWILENSFRSKISSHLAFQLLANPPYSSLHSEFWVPYSALQRRMKRFVIYNPLESATANDVGEKLKAVGKFLDGQCLSDVVFAGVGEMIPRKFRIDRKMEYRLTPLNNQQTKKRAFFVFRGSSNVTLRNRNNLMF